MVYFSIEKEQTMNLEDISPELQEMVKSCKSLDELVELAKSQDVDLPDEVLQAISGGELPDCPLVCRKFNPDTDEQEIF